MRRVILAVVVLLALGGLPNAAAGENGLEISVIKAPVAGDGVTAGAVTDIVINFVDLDPVVDGIGILEGGTVEIVLPDGFVNTGGGPNLGIILQGWPQSPPAPPPAFIWTTTVVDNTVTMTLDEDFLPGVFGPGPKQAHLALFGFQNPDPGRYRVHLTITPDPSAPGNTVEGVGKVRITPKSRPSINAISLFSAPPGPPPPFFNAIYQEVTLGDSARQVGHYLWKAGGGPYLGVDLKATGDPGHYRLVKGRRTVGHVWITTPPGATGFSLETLDAVVDPGSPEGPSEEVPAFLTGQPTGLLLTQFHPDPTLTGDYTLRWRMNNGNTQHLFVTVVD